MKKPFFPVALFFLLTVVLLDRQPAHADCRSFYDLISNGGYAVANQNGQIVSSCNETTPFTPASIIKIPLALAALDILGHDFRFTTEFYMDRQNNLYIKGYGDPFLVSEEIDLILDRLIEKGVEIINSIYIDNSTLNLEQQVPGRGKSNNPYDVPVNSVAVNFNTINIRVNGNGNVESAEPQTPTLPIMLELGQGFAPGVHRLNVCQGDCIAEEQSIRYASELFRALQRKKGIPGKGAQQRGEVPSGATLVYRHKNTRSLEEVVMSFLKYSNNFVANQVFVRCGAEQYGFPSTWEKARKAVRGSLARLLGLELSDEIVMIEGAGLSRKNMVTANSMLLVLEKFKPYVHLLQEKKNGRLKSGTLDGVYNFAGYLADGKPFVILLNQERNTRDRILERLEIIH